MCGICRYYLLRSNNGLTFSNLSFSILHIWDIYLTHLRYVSGRRQDHTCGGSLSITSYCTKATRYSIHAFDMPLTDVAARGIFLISDHCKFETISENNGYLNLILSLNNFLESKVIQVVWGNGAFSCQRRWGDWAQFCCWPYLCLLRSCDLLVVLEN
jgi:hypothetical protein